MGALPVAGRRAAARIFREGAQWVAAGPAGCGVPGCERPIFSGGWCGWHALQGRYRTVVSPGGHLDAVRVDRPPSFVVASL